MLGRATVGLISLVLVWGNLVAGLKAGLGCPDWPLCYGKVLPPYRWDTYMEFLHRVIAAAAGIALCALAVRRFRSYRGAARAVPAAAVLLLLAEAGMVGAVVLLEIPVQLTTVHFLAGLLIFLLAFYLAAFDGESSPPGFSLSGYASLFFALGWLVFLLAAMGAYVRHSEAGLALPDWPTNLGGLVPPLLSGGVLVHFAHRLLAAVVLASVGGLVVASSLDGRLARHRGAARGLLAMLLLQVGVGGAVVLTGLFFLSTALHLAIALGMLAVLSRMWFREIGWNAAAP